MILNILLYTFSVKDYNLTLQFLVRNFEVGLSYPLIILNHNSVTSQFPLALLQVWLPCCQLAHKLEDYSKELSDFIINFVTVPLFGLSLYESSSGIMSFIGLALQWIFLFGRVVS